MTAQLQDKPLANPIHEKLAGRKVAFLSVFNKSGIEHLARQLTEKHGYTLLSTGGTFKHLTEKGIDVIETSNITGFDELLGGRVKSLHPEIFAGILAERDKIEQNPEEAPPFLIDTVVVNLYPFEEEQQNGHFKTEDNNDPYHLLHFIDIGGSSLIRAAAKNYPAVNVLCRPEQYEEFLMQLENGDGDTPEDFRKQLAFDAFNRSRHYEACITRFFETEGCSPCGSNEPKQESPLDDTMTVTLNKITDLRYGENPHQQAALYGLNGAKPDFECLHGKELSYNNLLDMQAAWNVVTEFNDKPACVVVKHNNPCGVALSDKNLADAYETAFNVDSLSAFGGVVALNRPVDIETAKLMKEVFLEVIVAPAFEDDAFEYLSAKKNLRLVKRDWDQLPACFDGDIKQLTETLFLNQQVDAGKVTPVKSDSVRIAGDIKPTDTQLADMIFAWKICKHVKSNAIVLAKEGRAVGIGGGQTSRIGALEYALKVACDNAVGAVMASDGFLPQTDNITAASIAKISGIIQPGGSIKDPEVLSMANEKNIAMVLTGIREFKH